MTQNRIAEGDLLAAALELKEIAALEKQLKERRASIVAQIRDTVEAGTTIISSDGEMLAQVRAGARRFDAELAKQNLPAEQYSAICILQPDSRLAKQILAPAIYDLACKATENSVVAL